MEPSLTKYLTVKNHISFFFYFILFISLTSFPTKGWSYSEFTLEYKVIVTDSRSGEPMIGVNVYTDDMSFAGTTDMDGVIILKNIKHHQVVNFSYLGYKTLSLPFFRIRNMKGQIKMVEGVIEFRELVVIGRRDDSEGDVTNETTTINQKMIALSNPQTAADALSHHAGVFVQKSQMGGGSPIIRGFEANKVLLVLDGVRMNNAIYREGHLQNAITVDNSILQQAEVIYGPGSLMYGSDALGGVVHYRTRDPKVLFNDDKEYEWKTNAGVRFASANVEKSIHLDFDHSRQNWGSLTSISYVDYDDLRAGANRPIEYEDFGKRFYYVNINENVDETRRNSDPNIQIGTGYRQLDILQKLRFQPTENYYFIFNVQYSTSSDVPRYDVLTDTISSADDLKWAEWHYGPQNRLLSSFKTRLLKRTGIYDKATIIGAYQRIDEDRLKRKFHKSHRTFNNEDVHVFSFTMDFDKNFDKEESHLFSYGVDLAYNNVFSTAGNLNVRTGKVSYNEFTRYPSDRSNMSTFGAYANYRWRSRDSVVNFSAGLRYSTVELFAKYKEEDPIEWDSSLTTIGITTKNDDLTWATGLTINTKDGWKFRLLGSTAFRSPNIDDFAKMRVQDGFILVPNTELIPETAITGEVTLGKTIGRSSETGKYEISATGFYTYLNNAIVRMNASFLGDTMIIAEESFHRVQKNVNTNSAYVYGFSGNVIFDFNKKWKFRSGINYVKGRSSIDDKEIPTAHIPPLYGNVNLSFKTDQFTIEGVVRFNAKKPLSEYAPSGSSDNEEEATPEGTLVWTTYNVYSSYELTDSININLAVENIFDIHYRPFASGVSAAGRNFIISLRGTF